MERETARRFGRCKASPQDEPRASTSALLHGERGGRPRARAARVTRYMADLLVLWPVLLFWPAVVLSVLAASFGLARRRPTSVLVAAVLVGPASAYLAASPGFFLWGLFPVGVYLVAAVATRRNHRKLGTALVAANAGFFGWLALSVLG